MKREETMNSPVELVAPMASGAVDVHAGLILLVDDEPLLLRAYSRVLSSAGFKVITADSGEAALVKQREHAFDSVFLDLGLPGASGLEVAQAIHDRDPRLPVVLMTGAPSLETAIGAVSAGARRYLVKPIESPHLLSAAREAVAEHQKKERERKELHLPDGSQLDRAIEQLFMVYQPIVSWTRRQLFAYEALVRTREKSVPHPGALIDLAQKCNRLDELGRRIRAAAGPQAPNAPLLFVNLHPADLLDDDLYDAAAPLSQSARRVVLEVTERAGLDSIADLQERLGRLRRLGYRVAIDDLGEGYSGLTSLARVQPEFVKLDMSLVRNVDKSQAQRQIVRSTLRLCRELRCRVIAEGVETTAERDALADLGCDLLQGYLFARPAAEMASPVLR
jgi:EAL domain-containing protein (putative c-di-GMP-specific phosphodiesterase class I)